MRIILLTKSKKYHNYCVTGIREDTGEWVRLVSEDSSIHNAVTVVDMTYEDNSEAQILDIVEVKIKEHNPNYYQPENYVYDSTYYWEKIGQATIDHVLEIITQNDDFYVFHNDEKKLQKTFVQSLSTDEQYSLKLIELDEVEICVRDWDGDGRLSITASFTYNDIEYKYLKITDEYFKSQFNGEGWYKFKDVVLVISLADLYDRDDCHYKLVASIIYE